MSRRFRPKGSGWEAAGTFNPAVVFHDDQFLMLYRAQDASGTSRLGYAESADGISFKSTPASGALARNVIRKGRRGGRLRCEHDAIIREDWWWFIAASGIFAPEKDWEKRGQVPNVVFVEGLVQRGDRYFAYYGGADKYVGVATTKLLP